MQFAGQQVERAKLVRIQKELCEKIHLKMSKIQELVVVLKTQDLETVQSIDEQLRLPSRGRTDAGESKVSLHKSSAVGLSPLLDKSRFSLNMKESRGNQTNLHPDKAYLLLQENKGLR